MAILYDELFDIARLYKRLLVKDDSDSIAAAAVIDRLAREIEELNKALGYLAEARSGRGKHNSIIDAGRGTHKQTRGAGEHLRTPLT